METKFETGATSHAVNDLILYTDNTRVLAEYRDKIYKLYKPGDDSTIFAPLLFAAIQLYKKEFPVPEDHDHIDSLTQSQKEEYCKLYVDDYNNWRLEN
jgi:hypothetical protein